MKFKKSNKKVDYVMNPYRKKKIKLTKISGFFFVYYFCFLLSFFLLVFLTFILTFKF